MVCVSTVCGQCHSSCRARPPMAKRSPRPRPSACSVPRYCHRTTVLKLGRGLTRLSVSVSMSAYVFVCVCVYICGAEVHGRRMGLYFMQKLELPGGWAQYQRERGAVFNPFHKLNVAHARARSCNALCGQRSTSDADSQSTSVTRGSGSSCGRSGPWACPRTSETACSCSRPGTA